MIFWLKESGIDDIWPNHCVTQDLADFRSRETSKKISIIDVICHESPFLDQAEEAYSAADVTVFFISEFTENVWCHRFDRTKSIFFLAGNFHAGFKHARYFDYNIHLWETAEFYHQNPKLLNLLNRSTSKSKFFDVLLGRPKPHRDLIYEKIDHGNNIVTRFTDDLEHDLRHRSSKEFIWPSWIPRPENHMYFTREEVQLNGRSISISRVIPDEIYNQTHYSLIAETMDQGDWSFFSEKIAKPILARRLFLVAANQYYLEKLRDLGFMTFGSIIDESYDLDPDLHSRIDKIMSQVKWLQQQDTAVISKEIEPIIEHNFNVLFHNRWREDMMKQLREIMLEVNK
jgi:hypothetical protein